MKFKIWKLAEIEFDKNDAEIIVSLSLTLLFLSYHITKPFLILALATVYYFFYFRSLKINELLEWIMSKITCKRCPKCKSKELIPLGERFYDTSISDEFYPHYLCNKCDTTSIDATNGLIMVKDPHEIPF